MMSKASEYDPRYPGYRTRAERLFKHDLMSRPYYSRSNWVPPRQDGEWIKIGDIDNVGAKFLRWMVDNGLLERRRQGTSVKVLKNDWYRIKPKDTWYRAPPEDDFGDLWVPD